MPIIEIRKLIVAAAGRCFAIALLGLAATATNSFAQNRPNVVFWDERPECGIRKLADESLKFTCGSFDVNAEKLQTIENDKIKLTMLFARGTYRIALYIKVEKKNKEKLTLVPAEWSVAHYVSEEDFVQGKQPILNEKSLVPVMRSSRESIRSSSPVDPMKPSTRDPTLPPTSRTTMTVFDGMKVSQLPPRERQTVIKPPAPVSTIPTSSTVVLPRSKRAETFNNVPLEHKSVYVRGKVSGSVTFNRMTESAFQLALIHIGDTTYVVPLRWNP